MKNADKPAYPELVEQYDSNAFDGKENLYHGGLTKRERAAIAAMQGIWANSEFNTVQRISEQAQEEGVGSEQVIARIAVSSADALLKELEETQ